MEQTYADMLDAVRHGLEAASVRNVPYRGDTDYLLGAVEELTKLVHAVMLERGFVIE